MHGESHVLPPGRATLLRMILGGVAGLALVLVVVSLLNEADSSRSTLTTLRTAQPALIAAALAAETLSYLAIALVLALLMASISPWTAVRIALAAFGAGGLLPAQPAGGVALTVRELSRRGVTAGLATRIALVLLIVVPACSMALLAGPTLLLSATAAPLPDGWHRVVALLGILALALGGVILAAVLRPSLTSGLRYVRLDPAAASSAARSRRLRLLGLGSVYWLADATCLWLVARSLGIHLPLATLPMAYVTGAVVIAIPVLPGGLGGVEAAVPLVLSSGSVSLADAVLAVLAWRVLSFWLPAALGLGCLASLTRRGEPPPRATGSRPPRPTGVDGPGALC